MALYCWHPYRTLIIGGSETDKNNVLLNLIKHQRPDIDKTYFSVKDPFESKYQSILNGREKQRIKKLKNPEGIIDYSQTSGDFYENLESYSPIKKSEVLIVSVHIIADMEAIIIELFLRGRKLDVSLIYFTILFKSI